MEPKIDRFIYYHILSLKVVQVLRHALFFFAKIIYNLFVFVTFYCYVYVIFNNTKSYPDEMS